MLVLRIELECDELAVLLRGLGQWGGPASTSDAVAALLGLTDATTMTHEIRRIGGVLRVSQDLQAREWHMALAATEIVFISDRYGAGVEWETVTGFDDSHTVRVIRRLQRKLVAVC